MGKAPPRVPRPAICLMGQVCRRSGSCLGSGRAPTDCSSRPDTTGICACRWCSICTAVAARQPARPATAASRRLSASERFIVATLDAEGGRWNVPVQDNRADDVAYVRDVIAHVAARVCTDETRVYATGFSGGGRMSSLLGCQLGSRIAAIAPVSGLRFPGPCSGRPVPVLTFHGLADPQNPTTDTPQAVARSGWRAFPTRSQAGRATTRARGTSSSMTLPVRCLPCATTDARTVPKSA